jgi:hypothetical protein
MTISSPKPDPIAETLNMSPLEVLPPEPVSTSNTQVNDDYQFARCNIVNVIQKGQEALDGIMDVATRSQHPRSYEVAATLIKTISDANKDLLELAKQKKNIDGVVDTPKNVTNNLFVGSTAELQKLIKQSNEK